MIAFDGQCSGAGYLDPGTILVVYFIRFGFGEVAFVFNFCFSCFSVDNSFFPYLQ
jgi:hypothetical protein